MIALSRIGGLRAPSEFRHLKWSDVNVETGKMLVTAPKTKRQRRVKLFPRLLAVLEEHRELTGNQSEYVVDRPCYRARDANLRTQLGKILARAGIPSFHRPFDNFRASASTDLATIYPIKTAADWLGHSVQTALKYYHMSRDQDLTAAELVSLERAFGRIAGSALHNPVQQMANIGRIGSQALNGATVEHGVSAAALPSESPNCVFSEKEEVTPTGLEPVLPA